MELKRHLFKPQSLLSITCMPGAGNTEGGQACYLSCWSEARQQDRNEDEVTTRWESFLP